MNVTRAIQMPPPPQRAYSWCFTVNNYSEDEWSTIVSFLEREANRWIVGKEVGDSGTPHLQGYASFRRRYTRRTLSSVLNSRAHFEVARGTARQNREYCSKGGDYREGGEWPQREFKVDNSREAVGRAMAVAIRSGNGGIHEFSEQYPGQWYFSGHNLLRNALTLVSTENRPDIAVEWIWGLPGVGKSRLAHEKYPTGYIKDPRTKWWNGYMLEKEVIIDDFGPNGIDINHLLRWFDRYKCSVETKGGMVPLLADKFIVTSNFEPSDCFKDKDGVSHPQMDALYRRMVVIYME